MMDNLITKRQAVERMNDLMVIELKMTRPPTWNEVYNAIKELPSAQKKGQWLLHPCYMPHKNYCSCCEKDSPYDKRWEFCPNCGADMRGEADGENS